MAKREKRTNFSQLCPVCDSAFREIDFVIVEKAETRTVRHATCCRCRSSVLIFLLNNSTGMMSVGMPTDLDSAEVMNMFGNYTITTDEILDIHNLVARYPKCNVSRK